MARRRRHSSKMRSNRRHRHARRMLKNIFGADVMGDVVTPVLGGTAGFILARYAGNMLSERVPQLADPRYGKLAAAAVLIPATFAAARMYPGMIRQNSGAAVLGIGLAAAESFLRNTPLLGGAPVAALVAPTAAEIAAAPPDTSASPAAASGFGAYYNEGMLSGLGRGYDLSHAGAPYQGMLGLGEPTMYAAAGIGEYVNQPMSGLGDSGDGISGIGDLGEPGDQGAVDSSMNRMESISTITPTDIAMRAPTRPQVRRVTTPFASGPGNGDSGYAGGTFARHLFSGMF